LKVTCATAGLLDFGKNLGGKRKGGDRKSDTRDGGAAQTRVGDPKLEGFTTRKENLQKKPKSREKRVKKLKGWKLQRGLVEEWGRGAAWGSRTRDGTQAPSWGLKESRWAATERGENGTTTGEGNLSSLFFS